MWLAKIKYVLTESKWTIKLSVEIQIASTSHIKFPMTNLNLCKMSLDFLGLIVLYKFIMTCETWWRWGRKVNFSRHAGLTNMNNNDFDMTIRFWLLIYSRRSHNHHITNWNIYQLCFLLTKNTIVRSSTTNNIQNLTLSSISTDKDSTAKIATTTKGFRQKLTTADLMTVLLKFDN